MFNPPHPGLVLKELYIEPLNLTVTSVAKSLGVTRKTMTALINEHSGISVEMAIRLAAVFDTTPEHWLNLQQQYLLWKIKEKIDVSQLHPLFKKNIDSREFL